MRIYSQPSVLRIRNALSRVHYSNYAGKHQTGSYSRDVLVGIYRSPDCGALLMKLRTRRLKLDVLSRFLFDRSDIQDPGTSLLRAEGGRVSITCGGTNLSCGYPFAAYNLAYAFISPFASGTTANTLRLKELQTSLLKGAPRPMPNVLLFQLFLIFLHWP